MQHVQLIDFFNVVEQFASGLGFLLRRFLLCRLQILFLLLPPSLF